MPVLFSATALFMPQSIVTEASLQHPGWLPLLHPWRRAFGGPAKVGVEGRLGCVPLSLEVQKVYQQPQLDSKDL